MCFKSYLTLLHCRYKILCRHTFYSGLTFEQFKLFRIPTHKVHHCVTFWTTPFTHSPQGYPVEGIRLWVFQSRANSTIRPAPIENERDKTIWEVAEKETPLKVFIETIDQSNPSKPLMTYKRDEHNIIFLKFFDAQTDTMYYLTHVFLSQDSCIGRLNR